MKISILFPFFILAVTIFGCKSGELDQHFSLGGTLSWEAPTMYSDGTTLVQTDIREYRIYYRTASAYYSPNRYFTVSAPTTSIDLSRLNIPFSPSETYYFSITTVDITGIESGLSNECP